MGDTTAIAWTDHTFSPWWGCSRISPACRACYADAWAQRWGHQVWRRKGPRRMLSDTTWRNPLKWNREAEARGVPAMVFCASMADVFEDHPDVTEARKRLWDVIEKTPWLRWQLLTKRPENVNRMVPWGGDWPSWVWLGASVETPPFAEQRIPLLHRTGAKVRFLSCEPLLAPLSLERWLAAGSVDWMIAGGESGARARLTRLEWFRSLRDQCAAASTPFFFKQAGHALAREMGIPGKGENWDDLPEELRIRQFPASALAVTA